MTLLEDLIAWWKKHRAELRRQIEMMESGALRSGERRPGEGWVDTTKESLARASVPHRTHRPRDPGGLWCPQARQGVARLRNPMSNGIARASTKSSEGVGNRIPEEGYDCTT